jgi:hypothetical protein
MYKAILIAYEAIIYIICRLVNGDNDDICRKSWFPNQIFAIKDEISASSMYFSSYYIYK